MVLIQLNIPNELDKPLKHYMIDNDIKNKSDAIIKLIKNKLFLIDNGSQ